VKKNISRQKLTSFVFRRAGGFTLIELIVTVTVIMVLAGVGAMSLNKFNGLKELESVRDEVSDHLKLARNLAITKQLPGGTYDLKYVRVSLAGNSVTIAGIDSVGVAQTNPPYSTMTVVTSAGISVTSSSNFGFMKSNGRLTDVNGNLVGTTMTVEVTRGTDKKTININNWGIISNGN